METDVELRVTNKIVNDLKNYNLASKERRDRANGIGRSRIL